MRRVVAPGVVALGPEALDEGVTRVALEGEGAVFDALDYFVAGDAGWGKIKEVSRGEMGGRDREALPRSDLRTVSSVVCWPVSGLRTVLGVQRPSLGNC